ncbi:nucleic acid-binding protein [Coprinellus micaceus]|uniref:Nucleic acid-binding protein n=1 Tax=Coprinellus micaceus TaxID=71717 RepID=A0A4Y7TDU4_COPMI|nr:nucleic acid-binding protein [Coprinellus micaceus]
MKEVEGLGREGVMLRKSGSKYEGIPSSSLMRVKTFDAEAIATGYGAGKGKHAGPTGALQCKMGFGKTFSVSSGLSDKQRKNPPKIGSIIVYRFLELTRDGVLRFPTFVGEAADKTEPKGAEVSAARKAGVGVTMCKGLSSGRIAPWLQLAPDMRSGDQAVPR